MVKDFIECLPITDIPFTYVVFKPLKDVDPEVDNPEIILLLGDMGQVSALTVMANYHRAGNENVIFPQAAGCV